MRNILYKICVAFLCVLFLFSPIIVLNTNKNVSAESFEAISKAECVMEQKSRRILYASNADTRLPMASTTKILTAITILENCDDIDKIIEIPTKAVGIEGSSIYLKSGDKYSIRDLLYGLMLRSGNDCATALALNNSHSIDAFACKMNLTAQKAGALNSNFKNPHGLPCKEHYTTAKDLSAITCYAMNNSIFREIVSTKYYEPYSWKNKNKILSLYDYGIGVKTGFTKEAGRCLVSAAKKNDMTLICSVLGCATTYERSVKLLEDAFSLYKNTKLIEKNQVFTLDNKKVYAKDEFLYPLLEEEKPFVSIKLYKTSNNITYAKKDAIIGNFKIFLFKQLLFSGNLYIL